MAYKKITGDGENFIREVCKRANNKGTNSLLSGNNGILTFSDPPQPENKIWTANISGVGNNIELGEILIEYFNKYAKEYDLDANILAAQAYVESKYEVWTYNKLSAASGMGQFTPPTIHGVLFGSGGFYSGVKPFTDAEKVRLTSGLAQPFDANSYNPKKEENITAKRNRPILHQNLINNLDLMIKLQARYMRRIANKCDDLASTSLLCYSRGPAYASQTYSQAIQKIINEKKEGYLQEGINYVLQVFGILGDPNNEIIKDGKSNISKNYKPKGFSFGYFKKPYAGAPDDSLFNLGESFNPFAANVSESDEYNIKQDNFETYFDPIQKKTIPLSITTQTDYDYSLIYYPEKQYNAEEMANKNQIVLHHTVSGPSVQGDVYSWRQKGDKVSTAFLVSREGEIYQLYNSGYWGIHLFLNENPFLKMIQEYDADIENIPYYRQNMEKYSIGIELDSWGGLTLENGIWKNAYGGTVNNVQLYTSGNFPGKRSDREGFRDYLAFEKYTPKQIEATAALIKSLQDKWRFPLTYNESMWDFSPDAMNSESGIWSHVSYREDKSDCHPQPELINMLRNL